ncbi:MAG TPA: hypothetical protein VGJ78_18230 [Vicinamibacterales bacterium]|jgi:uncharacterized membrane protein
MNLAHVHLLLNHVPTIGFGFGIGLLVASIVRDSADLRRASYVVFFVVALVAIPTYLSGNAADFVLRTERELRQDVVTAHQNAAMLALIPMEIVGLVSWLALWQSRRWHQPAVLALSIVTFVLMARAANIGGQIRHPEIVAAGAAASAPSWPSPAAMGAAFVLDHPWVWPICEVFHFVGLCLLFGVTLLVNLRLAGFISGFPLADLNRLLPWAVAGLGINIVTGMLFFLAVPEQYTQNSTFTWKMGLVLLGGLSLLYPTMFDEEPDSAFDILHAAMTRRLIGVCSLVIWIAVIFFGRFLPYLGTE